MAARVRFAHIGVAYPHGMGWIETLLLMPEVEIVALYDPDAASASGMVPAELEGVPLYDDFGDLLAKERPEAVIVAQPNDITARYIAQAAEAGVHVLAEKPCARTASELMPALEAVNEAGVQFATGYMRRVSPVGRAIKDLVDRGVLGRLVSMEASWVTSSVTVRGPDQPMFSAESNGGGILHWLGCHWLDFMRWCTSCEVTEVAAILDTLGGESINVEDTAALSLRYDNGMIGSLHCSYVMDRMPHQNFFALRGTDGWVRWDQSGDEIEVRSAGPDVAVPLTQTMRFEADPTGGYEDGQGKGVVMLRRFVASFRDGEPPVVTVEDALRVLEVFDAAHESSRTGRRVATVRADGARP